MMLNEHIADLLPDKVKRQLNPSEVASINAMDNKVTKWFFVKGVMLLIAAVLIIMAMYQDSNIILFLSFGVLALYFISKYMEQYWESELAEYLIELQLYMALYKKD